MSWSICTENFASLKQAAISQMLRVSYTIGCCSDIPPWLRYSNLVCSVHEFYSALRRVHLFRPQIHLLEKLSLKRGVRKNMQLAEKLNNSKHQIQKSHLRFWIFPLTWKHWGISFLSSLFADFEYFCKVLFSVVSQSGSLSTAGFQRPAHWQRWTGFRCLSCTSILYRIINSGNALF